MNPVLRVAKNSAALSASVLVERAIAFFLPWYIVRTQGNEVWGLYNTALPFVLMATPFAFWGLDQLLPRVVARKVGTLGTLLGSALLITSVTGILVTLITLLITSFLNYPPNITRLIAIAVVSNVVPRSEATMFESILGGLERMELIALVRLPTTALRTVGSVLLLKQGYQLATLFIVLGLYHVFISMAYLWLLRRILVGFHLRIDRDTLATLSRNAVPFAVIVLTGETFRQIDRVFLSKIWDTGAVGYYATGTLLLEIMYLLAPAIMSAIFPSMSRMYVRSLDLFAQWAVQLFIIILLFTVPTALALFAFAGWLINAFFGANYEPSVAVLQITAIGLVPAFAARLLYRIMLASDNERLAVRTSFVKGLINISLAALLIPRYGIIGASAAAVGIEFFSLIQNLYYVNRWVVRLNLREMVLRPGLFVLLSTVLCVAFIGSNPMTAWLTASLAFVGAIVISRTLNLHELVNLAQERH